MHMTSRGGLASLTLLKHPHLTIIILKNRVLGLDEIGSQFPYCLKKQDFVILIPGSALDQAGVRMETGEGLGGEAWITARRDKNSPSRVYCCS